jgi:hypothetical protein
LAVPRWLGPLLLYAAVAVAFAPDAVTGQTAYWFHDLRHHHLPWREWAAGRWLAGEGPWWASGAANGFPLFAEGEGGFLYVPTMALFCALDGRLALSWSIAGHQVLAAMGLWALARSEGLRGAPALLAGLAWGFGGFLVSHTLYLGMQNGLAWLGWALFAVATGRAWLVALAVAAMGLAGHVQAAAFGGLLVTAQVLRLRAWRSIVGGLAGLAVASPQLAATWELTAFSARDGGVSDAFADIGRIPLQELGNGFLPALFGLDRPADVAQTYYHRGPSYWGSGVNHWETCFYLGIPVFVASLAGIRRAPFWGLMASVSMALMVGSPLWWLVRHLPGFGGFRFPARFSLVLCLAVAMLAAHGAHELSKMRRPWVARWRLHFALAVVTLYTGLGYLGTHTREGELRSWLTRRYAERVDPPEPELPPMLAAALPPPERLDDDAIAARVETIVRELRLSTSPRSPRVLWPALFLLLTAAAIHRPRRLLLLAAWDLWVFGHDYQARVPWADAQPAVRWLSEGMRRPGGWRVTTLDRRQDARLDAWTLPASLGLPLGTADVLIPSPLLMVRNEAMLATAGLDVGDLGPQKVRRYLENIGVARRMALRWIVSVHDIPGLLPVLRGTPVNVWQDQEALPRARVVPCAEAVADGEAAFAAITARDPRRVVLVEGDGDAAGTVAGGTVACAAGGSARIASYTDEHVEVQASGPGTLVLADSWYPGWTATLDAQPVPIARADVLFRAVSLPEGDHVVAFDYAPTWRGWGLAALGGLFTTLGLARRTRADRR